MYLSMIANSITITIQSLFLLLERYISHKTPRKINHDFSSRIATVTFSVRVNLRGTLTIYRQCGTVVHERSISEAVHCVAFRYSVYGYHVITGRMSTFTLHFFNPITSTPIVFSDCSWNTRVNVPGSAIMHSWAQKPIQFIITCFVTLLVKAFPVCFKGLVDLRLAS